MKTYLVVIGRTSTGYSGHCPDVPGCAAVGKSIEQVIRNMKGALELHFEGMAEDGERIPRPSGVKRYRELSKQLDVSDYVLGHFRIDTRRYSTVASRS